MEVHGDARISELFAETDDAYFQARLNEFICQIADGPCEYTGLPMPDAHSGMDISEREFNYFVEDLERAMARPDCRSPCRIGCSRGWRACART